MKQYCRYCIWLCTGNGIWCDMHEKELAESTTKTVNNCKDFSFCEADAYMETDGYKPRAPRRSIVAAEEGVQISIDDVLPMMEE